MGLKQLIVDKFLNKGVRLLVLRKFPKPAIVNISKTLKGELTGAEIGVCEGVNAKSILETLNIRKLFLVDEYKVYGDYNNMDFKTQEILNRAEKSMQKRTKKYSDKVVQIKEDSTAALDFIPCNLDFVYIDGNHNYEYVKKDIENYYGKVRDGGIVSGHDINLPSVVKAVTEFTNKRNIDLHSYNQDWWFVK